MKTGGHDIGVLPNLVSVDYGPFDRREQEPIIIGCRRCGITIKHVSELDGVPCEPVE